MNDFLRVPGFQYPKPTSEPVPLKDEPVGPMRQVRLDLRLLLNQNDGTFDTTHQIADDIAGLLVRNLRAAGYLKDAPARHDHSTEPRVWCKTHQNEHIASVPRFTYQCKSCGWGQWYKLQAEAHEQALPGHETYEVEHVMVPLDERPALVSGNRESATSVEDWARREAERLATHDSEELPSHDRAVMVGMKQGIVHAFDALLSDEAVAVLAVAILGYEPHPDELPNLMADTKEGLQAAIDAVTGESE